MTYLNEPLSENRTACDLLSDGESYEALEIEVISFDSEDVITASGGNESPWDTN